MSSPSTIDRNYVALLQYLPQLHPQLGYYYEGEVAIANLKKWIESYQGQDITSYSIHYSRGNETFSVVANLECDSGSIASTVDDVGILLISMILGENCGQQIWPHNILDSIKFKNWRNRQGL